jgi:hypothetical protein
LEKKTKLMLWKIKHEEEGKEALRSGANKAFFFKGRACGLFRGGSWNSLPLPLPPTHSYIPGGRIPVWISG